MGLVKEGFAVAIVEDAVKPVARESGLAALRELASAGVRFVKTAEVVQ